MPWIRRRQPKPPTLDGYGITAAAIVFFLQEQRSELGGSAQQLCGRPAPK